MITNDWVIFYGMLGMFIIGYIAARRNYLDKLSDIQGNLNLSLKLQNVYRERCYKLEREKANEEWM